LLGGLEQPAYQQVAGDQHGQAAAGQGGGRGDADQLGRGGTGVAGGWGQRRRVGRVLGGEERGARGVNPAVALGHRAQSFSGLTHLVDAAGQVLLLVAARRLVRAGQERGPDDAEGQRWDRTAVLDVLVCLVDLLQRRAEDCPGALEDDLRIVLHRHRSLPRAVAWRPSCQ
jgi:hypothetical protein